MRHINLAQSLADFALKYNFQGIRILGTSHTQFSSLYKFSVSAAISNQTFLQRIWR